MNENLRGLLKKMYYRIPIKKNILRDFYNRYLHGIYRLRTVPCKAGIKYELNPEIGLMDIGSRLESVFEYPDMIATNQTIGRYFLTSDIHRVINIGSGVGTFEQQIAPFHLDISFFACEMDVTSTKWAMENRPHQNVTYSVEDMSTILKERPQFDLAVSVDVIEHVKDYKGFLDEFVMLADKAVIATPNRDRSFVQIKKPQYKFHVQEFNAGELFFILKMYYRKVELFSQPDILKTDLVPVGLYSTYDKLFAYCER